MTPRNKDLDPRDPKDHWPPDKQSLRGEGQRRKDAALLLLEFRRESYIRLGRRALLETLIDRGVATVDDVRAAVPLPEGVDPKAFGAVPGPLVRAGVIRRAGFASTSRPIAHHRTVSVWELADAKAAERWLAAHPPIPLITSDDTSTTEVTPQNDAPPVPLGKARTEGAMDGSNPDKEDSNRG